MSSSTSATISAYYQSIQFRTGPEGEIKSYSALVADGAMTLEQVRAAIIDDPYTTNNVDVVVRMYQAAFGRLPEKASSLEFYADRLASGVEQPWTLAFTFARSPEFVERYGLTFNERPNAAFITAMYLNVLGRAPDDAGFAYYLNGSMTVSQILQGFAQSPEFRDRTDAAVESLLNANALGTANFTGPLQIVTPAQSFTLTTDAPTVTEGDAGQKALTFTLTLHEAPTMAVTVNYQTLTSGSAKAGDDFGVAAGTVTFAAGQRTATVSVDVLGDTAFEAGETVQVQFSGTRLVSSVTATGTIANDDIDPATAPQTFVLTAGADTGAAFTGANGNDVFNATGATLSQGDSLNGGAGADSLVVIDSTGASANGLPAVGQSNTNVTLTSIEAMSVDASGSVGTNASSGTAQVTTYTMPGDVAHIANVQQSNQYVFGSGTTIGAQNFTYGGAAGSFVTDTTDSTSASNFVAAVNSVAGSTVAFRGDQVAINLPAGYTAGNTALKIDGLAGGFAPLVGMAVSGTGIAAGTTVTAWNAVSSIVTLSQAISATLADDATFNIGGGDAGVTVFAPVAGTVSPSIAFTAITGDVAYPTQSLIRANVDGNIGETVSFTYNGATGSYVLGADATATANNFRTALDALVGPEGTVGGTLGVVTVTSTTPGTALLPVAFSGATGNLPVTSITTANGTATVSAVVYDISSFTDLQTFTADAAGGINLQAAGGTDLSLESASGNVNVAGGKAVTVAANGAVTLSGSLTSANVTTTGTNATSVTGAALTNVSVTGGGAVTISNGHTATTLNTVSVTRAADDVSITANGLTTLNLSGMTGATTVGDTTITAAAGTRALTVNLNGMDSGGNGAASTGGFTVTDAEATSLAITSGTAASYDMAFTVAKATGVTVDASVTTQLDGITAGVATSLGLSGAGNITIGAQTLAATAVITSTGTGNRTLEGALATGQTYTGSSGADAITLANAFTKAITTGDGDDVVTYGGAAGTGGSVNAGGGIDTIVMTSAQAEAADDNATFNSRFSGFETLGIGDALGATAALNLTGLNNVSTVVLAAGGGHASTASINNLVSGGTVRLTHDLTGVTIGVRDAAFNAADSVNLVLSKTGGVLAAGTITVADVQTVNIFASDASTAALGSAAHVNTMTLAATAATTITVSGNNGLNLTNTNNTAVTRFDASGVVANGNGTAGATDAANLLAVTFTSANTTSTATVTIIGGAGNDSLTGNAGMDVITGGAGADVIDGAAGSDTLTGGAGADVITGGAAADTIDLAETTSAIDTIRYAESGAVNVDTVTGFRVGTDIVSFSTGNIAEAGVGTVTLSTGGGADIAAAVAASSTVFTTVAKNATVANAATTEVLKFSALDATSFATAIGNGTYGVADTGASELGATEGLAAIFYDSLNSQAVFGYVRNTNTATANVINSADTFVEVARVSMIGTDFTALNNTSFSLFA